MTSTRCRIRPRDAGMELRLDPLLPLRNLRVGLSQFGVAARSRPEFRVVSLTTFLDDLGEQLLERNPFPTLGG